VFDTSETLTHKRSSLVDTFFNRETETNKLVVKMLRDDLKEEDHTKGVADISIEVRILTNLSHPHFIAMKYIGSSLIHLEFIHDKYNLFRFRFTYILEFIYNLYF